MAFLALWSFGVMIVTAILLFLFTYGDCYEDVCIETTNRNFFLIAGCGFAIYWTVFFALVRRWSRS